MSAKPKRNVDRERKIINLRLTHVVDKKIDLFITEIYALAPDELHAAAITAEIKRKAEAKSNNVARDRQIQREAPILLAKLKQAKLMMARKPSPDFAAIDEAVELSEWVEQNQCRTSAAAMVKALTENQASAKLVYEILKTIPGIARIGVDQIKRIAEEGKNPQRRARRGVKPVKA